MDRHDELILLILRYTRENATGSRPLSDPDFEGFTREQVHYHIRLCDQAGYLTVRESGRRNRIIELTWNGHEKLAASQDG